MGFLVTPSIGTAELFFGPANSDIHVHHLQEFLLFDGVTKSQVIGFHFTFQSDEMPVGVVLPIKPQDNVIAGKPSIFDQISKNHQTESA